MATNFGSKDKSRQKNSLLTANLSPGHSEDFMPLGLVDQIARRLKEDILRGLLKGGEQLREEHLKNAFSVSRTPLREAFRVLEKEDLVQILPRKGTFVKKISVEDIKKNFPVRACLEGFAARLAYTNLTEQGIEKLETLFGEMKEAVKRDDFIAYAKHHVSFHEVFIQASENEILIDILNKILIRINNFRMHTLWHRYTFHYYKEESRNSLKVHRRILDLLKSRKATPEEFEKIFREHIEVALQPFLAAMEKLGEEDAR